MPLEDYAERPHARSYVSATAVILLVLAAQALMRAVIPTALISLLYPATFLLAWRFGFGPAVLSSAVSVVGYFGLYWLHPSRATTLDRSDVIRLLLFFGFSSLIAWMIERGRRAERALRRQFQRLEESEAELRRFQQRLSAAQRTARLGIVDWSCKNSWIDWSPELGEMLGVVPHSTEEIRTEWLSRIHPEDVSNLQRSYEAWINSPSEDYFERDYRYHHPDGRLLWIGSRLRKIRDESGEVSRILGIQMDMTARKTAELEKERAVQSRDEFMAAVAHDLKNPLTAIDMNADLIAINAGQPDRKELIRSRALAIRQATSRTIRMIADLLEISRIETGRIELHPTTCPVSAVLQPIIGELRPLLETRKIRLEERVTDWDEEIVCDSDRLARVFSNILGNAIKFIPENAGRIELDSRNAPDELVFSIRDNGPGVSPADLPFVFDRYWHSKASEKAGSGLGLAIAKGIVEAHGGRIWAENCPGGGACFHFSVPKKDSAAAQRLIRSAAKKTAA